MNPQKTREIVIVAYRPEWPGEYEQIAQRLAHALGDAALRIDHIGSTSVPGLAAKDIVDVQVTVAKLTDDLDELFERAGCTRMVEMDHDHVPPTAADSAQEWQKMMYRRPADMRPTNIHVRRAGSANGRYALLFRDYLRAHPMAAAAYAQVKTALSNHDRTDWDLYYDVKDPVCDIVMDGANDWAAATNWHPQHYARQR